MRGGAPVNGGRQAAVLLLAAGGLTLVNNYLPGSEQLDLAPLNLVGALAIVAGAISWFVPWHRLPPAATLVHVPVALGLIATANLLGGVSHYSYAVYFVVFFVWVGLSQPPGTSWLLVPPAAAAYVVPLLIRDDTGTGGVSSVGVAVPVCVLVAETIARTTRRQRLAQQEALHRAQLSERLLDAVGEVNSTLDPSAALPRICEGARRLVGAAGTGFVTADGDVATVVEVAGLPAGLVGVRYPVGDGSIGDVIRTRRPVVVRDFDRYPMFVAELRAAVPGLHEIVAVPTVTGGTVTGALYAVVGADRAPLLPAELDALTVLAGHVGAALRNAASHTEVLRRRAHEQAVIDGMADGMAVLGRDGLVRSWNAAAQRLTGVSADQAVGKPLPFGASVGVAVSHRTPAGRWLEVVASPLDEGELVVGIRDVSAAKELDEAKDLFLATTSHELRTPLTVVKGYTATLLRRWADLPDGLRAEALGVIADRTDALIELVDHLLLGAKAGAGRHTLTRGAVELAPVLDAAARQTTVVNPRHPVRVEVPPGLAAIADETALDQVLGQLLENAVKYSPNGGPVEIRAGRDGDEVYVTVADRGTGLLPGSEQAVFERFVQGHQGDRRPYGGVGLGLHIVRNLVEGMQGTVSATRREGGGSEFTFRLPGAPPVAAQRRPEPRYDAAS